MPSLLANFIVKYDKRKSKSVQEKLININNYTKVNVELFLIFILIETFCITLNPMCLNLYL